jgi:hypothetical protein
MIAVAARTDIDTHDGKPSLNEWQIAPGRGLLTVRQAKEPSCVAIYRA